MLSCRHQIQWRPGALIVHLKRSTYFVLGASSLLCGIVGIFLPLLPTTPFVLLAAFCFSRSSERVHQWLLNNRYFGKIISDWETHGVIRTRTKWIATLSIVILASYPVLFMIPILWLKIVTVATLLCVMLFIWTRPSHSAVEVDAL